MAKKSPLTEKQWAEIEKRYLAGESARKLGVEFKIAESTIRSRFSAQSAQIKTVANQVIEAEKAFNSLPYSAQVSAQSLINELRAVSTHLAGAAKYGAMTAHRLSGIANQHVDKINDADIGGSMETLKEIAALTEVANKSAQTGLNLLAANKDRLEKLDDDEDQPESKRLVFEAVDGRKK